MMKRTHNERSQMSSRPRFPRNTTAYFLRNQTQFRNHSESANKEIIRNNNLQLSFCEDQINPSRLLSFEATRRQFTPNSVGLNRHQPTLPSAMNRFAFGGRQFYQFTAYPRIFQQSFRSACNSYSRSNSQRFPGTTSQFQEMQQRRNAKFTQQRNYTISSAKLQSKGREFKPEYAGRNRVSMRRKWHALPEARQSRVDEFCFSLVTYNMLSDSLLYENMFLYEDCDEDYLSWGYRKQRLLAELLGYDAEILCLQEVDACHYENWFLPKLQEAGYMGLFIKRTGEKPDGCAVFYRHSKFTLVKHKLVKYYTPQVQRLDKDNVGIVLLLKANTPDSKTKDPLICVANTHLLFNKKRGDIKLAQLAYLFAEIHELAVLSKDDNQTTHCPVILCGDLNSFPYSPLYHLIISGRLDYSTRSAAVISGQLTSSESKRGPSSRLIRTPLLPWEFGVSTDCQWRGERNGKPEGSSTVTQDSESIKDTLDLKGELTQQNCRSSLDGESSSSTKAGLCTNETFRRADSGRFSEFRQSNDTSRYAARNNLNDSGISKDSERQPNPSKDALNEETRSQGNEFLKHVQSNSTGEPEWKASRQSYRLYNRMAVPNENRNNKLPIGENQFSNFSVLDQSRSTVEVIDLDANSPNPDSRAADWKRGRKSDTSRGSETPEDMVRKTERGAESVDSQNRIAEAKRAADYSGDFAIDAEAKPHGWASRTGEQDDDNSLATAFSRPTELEIEKTNYNKNGIISIPWKFKSVYTHRFPDGTPEVTTCHSKACCNVDYIFYTTSQRDDGNCEEQRKYVQSGKLTLIGRLELRRKSDFQDMSLLPNHIFPSDHLALQARFRLC